jgi:hypothetical protein
MRIQRECFQDEVGPMADIVFVGCSLAEAAAPLTPAGGAAPPLLQCPVRARLFDLSRPLQRASAEETSYRVFTGALLRLDRLHL